MAKPPAQILFASMMLRYLGDRHSDCNADQAGLAIESAVTRLLAEQSIRTADLGDTSSTIAVAEAAIQKLDARNTKSPPSATHRYHSLVNDA